MVIALKNIGQPEHDRGKVLGIAVRVHAVAHDTDTGDGGVKGCGGDHLAVPVQLKAQSDIHVLVFLIPHIQDFFVGHVLTVCVLNWLSLIVQVNIIQGIRIVDLDAAVGDKALIVDSKGGVQGVRPGEHKIIAVFAVHGLNNGLGALSYDLPLGIQGAEVGIIQAAEGGDAAGVLYQTVITVQHARQSAPRRLVLMQDGVVVGILRIGGVEGTVNFEGPGGRGGIRRIGAELPLGHQLGHGGVQGVGGLHEIGAVHPQGAVSCNTNHNQYLLLFPFQTLDNHAVDQGIQSLFQYCHQPAGGGIRLLIDHQIRGLVIQIHTGYAVPVGVDGVIYGEIVVQLGSSTHLILCQGGLGAEQPILERHGNGGAHGTLANITRINPVLFGEYLEESGQVGAVVGGGVGVGGGEHVHLALRPVL